MAALGLERTSWFVEGMSALPPRADIGTQLRNVRFLLKARQLRQFMAAHATSLTLYSLHFSSIPFNECSPASSNLIPQPMQSWWNGMALITVLPRASMLGLAMREFGPSSGPLHSRSW